jgi:hypothetical protein
MSHDSCSLSSILIMGDGNDGIPATVVLGSYFNVKDPLRDVMGPSSLIRRLLLEWPGTIPISNGLD